MGATYDVAIGTDKDQVRFLVQDTDLTRPKFQDEEIAWVITQEMNVYMAAARLCDTLVTKAGGIRSKTVGGLSITYDPAFYAQLGSSLRARGCSYEIPYAGGISVADKAAQKADTDWVTPKIPRGLEENPAAPQPGQPSDNPLTVI